MKSIVSGEVNIIYLNNILRFLAFHYTLVRKSWLFKEYRPFSYLYNIFMSHSQLKL